MYWCYVVSIRYYYYVVKSWFFQDGPVKTGVPNPVHQGGNAIAFAGPDHESRATGASGYMRPEVPPGDPRAAQHVGPASHGECLGTRSYGIQARAVFTRKCGQNALLPVHAVFSRFKVSVCVPDAFMKEKLSSLFNEPYNVICCKILRNVLIPRFYRCRLSQHNNHWNHWLFL